MKWKQEYTEALKNVTTTIGAALFKLVVFCAWLIFSCVEILIRELNKKMKNYLFPNRR